MNNNFQAPPPSYGEVAQASAPPVLEERAPMYAYPQQAQYDANKYSTVPSTTAVAYGVQLTPLPRLARNPVQCTCVNCRSVIITRIEQTNGLLTWLLCLFLVLFGCVLGCCLIPFCIPDLQNVQHYCPNCNAFIGEYRTL